MARTLKALSQGLKIRREFQTGATTTKVSKSRFSIIADSAPTRDFAPTGWLRFFMLGKNHSLRQAEEDWMK